MAIGGVKSKETRSYQKGKCNSPIIKHISRACVVSVLNIGLLHFPF